MKLITINKNDNRQRSVISWFGSENYVARKLKITFRNTSCCMLYINSGKHLTWTGSPLSPFRDQRVKYELKQVIRAADTDNAWKQHFKNQNQADFLDLFLSDLICRVNNSARPSDGRGDLHTAVTPHYITLLVSFYFSQKRQIDISFICSWLYPL